MVKSFLSLLSTRQTNILTGATILMIAVFASRFLGLIRTRLLFNNFDTATSSIFFAAFQLPDLLFQLLIFGALSVAFVPVFTEYMNRKGENEAFNFASNILNLSLLVFGLVCIISAIFVSPLNDILVPGFEGKQKQLTDNLTRIILLGQLLLVIGSLFIGIAQSFQRFLLPALAPLFYNLGIIFGIIFLSPKFGITGPAIGVVIGAFLHVAIQIPFLKSMGFRYTFSFDFLNKGVRDVFRLMSVRTLGLALEQVMEKVGFALATLISASSGALLISAQMLYFAPVGLFGATIAQAALPVLSREWVKGEKDLFKTTLLTTMHQILFLTLPAAAILIVLRIPVVRLMYGATHFNWEDTVLTGRTVAFLSTALAAQSVILLFIRGFYASKDTKTPLLVSIVTVVLNVALSWWFVSTLKLDVWSLGLAYSIATNTSIIVLLYFLNKKVGGFNGRQLFSPALKMLLSAAIAAAALYIPMKALDQLVFDTTRTINLIFLTGIASILGLSIYILLVWFMQVKELYTFVNLLKKIYQRKIKVKPSEIVHDPDSV